MRPEIMYLLLYLTGLVLGGLLSHLVTARRAKSWREELGETFTTAYQSFQVLVSTALGFVSAGCLP